MAEAADGPAPAVPAAGGAPSAIAAACPLADIQQVLMHMGRPCKMGISFWPSMRFNADRPAQPGVSRLLRPGDPWLSAPPAAPAAPAAAAAAELPRSGGGAPEPPPADGVAAEVTLSGGGAAAKDAQPAGPAAGAPPAAGGSTGTLRSRAAAAAAVAAGRRLLLVDFTKDPPDEFQVGAKFMCGLPFPFISIRTTRLAGVVDVDSGEVSLEFISEFLAQSGNKEPTVLQVGCDLTTEATEVLGKTISGERLRGGRCTLIAHALVPKTKSWFANLILWLPTAARAWLPMRLEFLPAPAAAAAPAAALEAAGRGEPAAAAAPAPA